MFLADLKNFWQANLEAILPTASVYLSIAPENPTFPYVVLTMVSLVPTYTTGAGHFETLTFRLAVMSNAAGTANSLATQIADVLDMSKPSTASIICKRTAGPVVLADETEPQRVFSAIVTYDLVQNVAVGNLS